jgi:hypothetical protein
MLRHRLHFSHHGQHDGAPQLAASVPITVRTPREHLPTPFLSAPLTLPRRINIPPSSHRHFGSLARRLGRIFAHAFFHHREAFEQAEAESSLYARFVALSYKYDLVPPEIFLIPEQDPEARRHVEELTLIISVG